jgi:murein L,D-transpeptidase YafK
VLSASLMMRCLKILFPIAALALVGAAAPPVDQVVIDKSDRTMWLFAAGKVIRTYTGIKLGDAPVGHKQFEGDEKTPEGSYIISGRNLQSRYHLSLRVSYPNAADRAFAARNRRSPGGDIFIHGQPNGYPLARIPTDWTDGCVALSNAEIDEVWRLVKTGTEVIIRP